MAEALLLTFTSASAVCLPGAAGDPFADSSGDPTAGTTEVSGWDLGGGWFSGMSGGGWQLHAGLSVPARACSPPAPCLTVPRATALPFANPGHAFQATSRQPHPSPSPPPCWSGPCWPSARASPPPARPPPRWNRWVGGRPPRRLHRPAPRSASFLARPPLRMPLMNTRAPSLNVRHRSAGGRTTC